MAHTEEKSDDCRTSFLSRMAWCRFLSFVTCMLKLVLQDSSGSYAEDPSSPSRTHQTSPPPLNRASSGLPETLITYRFVCCSCKFGTSATKM